jgi:hypothetical protein
MKAIDFILNFRLYRQSLYPNVNSMNFNNTTLSLSIIKIKFII